MKKKYYVAIIDFNKNGGRGRIVSERYADGLRDARRGLPCKISYCRNADCFTGWTDNGINAVVSECRTRYK